MELFDIFGNKADINTLVEEARQTDGAVLIDVRTPEEFASGHIEGAYNIPLDRIESTLKIVQDKSTPLYLYCRSGARSGRACSYLQSEGYTNAVNIGGVMSWRGPIVSES